MKKNYIHPIVTVKVIRMRTNLLSASDSSDGVNVNDEGTTAEQLGHSIWNDETADGFNW